MCTTDLPLAAALFVVVPLTKSNVMGATFPEESSKENSRVPHVNYTQVGGIAASKSRNCAVSSAP